MKIASHYLLNIKQILQKNKILWLLFYYFTVKLIITTEKNIILK